MEDIKNYGRGIGRSFGRSKAITAEYELQKSHAIYFMVGGIISGLLFFGFGELVERNRLIEHNLRKKNNNIHSKIPSLEHNYNDAQNNEMYGETRKCPYCAEIIKKEAIFCRYCKKDLN